MAIERQFATIGTKQEDESPIQATMPKPVSLIDKGSSQEMLEFVEWADKVDASRGRVPARERVVFEVPRTGFISFLASNIEAILDWKDQIVYNKIYRPLNSAMRPRVQPRSLVRTIVQDHLGILRSPTTGQRARNPELETVRRSNNGIEAFILNALDAKDRINGNIEVFLQSLDPKIDSIQARIARGIIATSEILSAGFTSVNSTLEWSRCRFTEFRQWDQELTVNFLAVAGESLGNLQDFTTEQLTRINDFVMSPEGAAYRKRVLKASAAGVIALGIYRLGSHLMELNIESFLQNMVAAGSFAFSYMSVDRLRTTFIGEKFNSTIGETLQWARNEKVRIKSGKIMQAVMAGVLAATILPAYMAPPTPAQTRFALYRSTLSVENQNKLLMQEVYRDVQLHPENIMLYLSRGYATVEGQRVPVDMSLLNFASGDQMPLRFVQSDTGELLFTAHKKIWEPNAEISPEMIEILKDVESAPYDRNIAAFEWLIKVIPRAMRGDSSGGTTPDMGIIKLTDGKIGEDSLLSGSSMSFVYHPELYSTDYLARLAISVYQGKVPADLATLMEGNDIPELRTLNDLSIDKTKTGIVIAGMQLDDLGVVKQLREMQGSTKDKIDAACMKLEALVIGQRLVALYGEDAVVRAWANNLPFSNARDSHLAIQGVPAMSWYLFNKPEKNLTKLERIVIARMIHQPGFYLNDLYKTIPNGYSPAVLDAIYGWDESIEGGHPQQGLLDIMLKKAQITQQEYDQFRKQRKDLHFVLETPDGFVNMFLARNGIQGDSREIAEAIYNGQPGNRFLIDGQNASRIIEVSPDEIVVGLDLSPKGKTELTKPAITNPLVAIESESLYGPSMEQYIHSNLVRHEEGRRVYYTFTGQDGKTLVEYTKGKARELRISEFEGNPGLMVASSSVVTGTTEIHHATYDGTAGVLEGQYVQPGSTIKLIMWSIALKEGFVKDFYKDQIFYHPARVRLALNDTRIVKTNGGEWEMISPAEALVNSRNEPVLEVIQRILYSNLPLDAGFVQDPKRLNFLGLIGTNNAAKNEVRRRWNEIIQGNLKKFGIVFCDIDGNELTEPTGIEAIGTDVFIKDANGKVSSLQAYSDSFLAFADPTLLPEVASDSRLTRAVRIVGGALTDPKLRSKSNMRWGNPDGGDGIILGGKGGTDMIGDNRTVAILGAFFSISKDGIRTVVSYQVGQRNGVPLNLDEENKAIGVGAESASILQLSRDVILRSNKISPVDVSISRTDKDSILKNIESGNVKVAVLKNTTKVSALEGGASIVIEKGKTLDLIGGPVNFIRSGNFGQIQRQKVAWIDSNGKYVEGYVYLDGLIGDYFDLDLKDIEAGDTKIVEETQAILNDAIAKNKDATQKNESGIGNLADQDLLILDKNESSPTLKLIFENINASGQVGQGPDLSADLMKQLGLPGDTVIINKAQLQLYINEAKRDIINRQTVRINEHREMMMGYSEDMLTRIVENLLRQQKIQNLLEKFEGNGSNLQKLIWKNGKLTPAGVFLYSLSDEDINSTSGYRGGLSSILMLPFDNQSPVTEKWARLREIGSLYRKIQNYTTTPEEKRQLATLLRQLATSPSKDELEALGIGKTPVPVTNIEIDSALRR